MNSPRIFFLLIGMILSYSSSFAQSNRIELSYFTSSTALKMEHPELNLDEDKVEGEGHGISMAGIGSIIKDKIYIRSEIGIISSRHSVIGSFFHDFEQRNISLSGHWDNTTIFFALNPELNLWVKKWNFFINAGPIWSADIRLVQNELVVQDRLSSFTGDRRSFGFNGQLGVAYWIKDFSLGMKFSYVHFGKKDMVNRFFPDYSLSASSIALVCGFSL